MIEHLKDMNLEKRYVLTAYRFFLMTLHGKAVQYHPVNYVNSIILKPST